MKTNYESIDQYIGTFPVATQKILEELRSAIRASAPGSIEKISYQIPTFFLNGNLVHFAAYENHIGFYPGAGAVKKFQDDLKIYKTAKGSVQFPIQQPLPLKLIEKIVKSRVSENLTKARKGKG